MENITFEITREDIKNYLNEHKENYKYCEAMFIKYLKENQFRLTRETFQMIMKKHNGVLPMDRYESEMSGYYSLPCFNGRNSMIQNLDLSGICHILIPTMKYYGDKTFTMNHLSVNLCSLANLLLVPVVNQTEVVESTLDDYELCGKIEKDGKMITVKMGKDHCRKELLAYEDFYYDCKIKRIRKEIRENTKSLA